MKDILMAKQERGLTDHEIVGLKTHA